MRNPKKGVAMRFEDEPLNPADPLPILPGHESASRLERVLRAGQFAVTTELAPPDSANAEDVYQRARIFDGYVDGINATDGSGAHCHMSSVGVCALLTRAGYSPVMQISCRDRNRIAIQGDILGAAAMGVSNLLCLTGDGVQCGDHPGAKPVFDLDCMSLMEIARGMRDGAHFQSGRQLTDPPRIFMGAAANPFAPGRQFRAQRLRKKVLAGAQFIQTQYCFDVPMLKQYMEDVRNLDMENPPFILVGVGPVASARTAEWMRKNVPGVHIPDSVIKRLAGAEAPKREGRRICVEIIQQLADIEGVSGVHVMAYRQEEAVAEMIQSAGVLAGRVPWYPGRDNQYGTYN